MKQRRRKTPSNPPTPIIAVIGSRHSGKTTTVEAIVRGLTAKGYEVATAKHIHQLDFTIDTRGRDTWRHAQAGAHTIVAVAAHELTTIKKTDISKLTLSSIVKNCENNTDIIITEGFRNLVAQDQTVPKIVTVKNKHEINEAKQTFKPILAFTTTSSKLEQRARKPKIPLIKTTKEAERLIEIIDNRTRPVITKRRETRNSTSIDINGNMLPLNPYVQKVTRNVLLGVVSTLKGANIKGNENVKITIETPKT